MAKPKAKARTKVQPKIHNTSNSKMTPEEARDFLWRKGIIAPMKLDTAQLEGHRRKNEAFNANPRALTWAENWSRRRGKSYTNIVDALEFGLTQERAILRYACETQIMVKDIIEPLIEELTLDCPVDIKPYWDNRRRGYYFPSTGSILKIAGCDNKRNANRLRGTACHRGYIDECGQISILTYVLDSVLMPQVLTTGGSICLFSTPSTEIASDWWYIMEKCKLSGRYTELDIFTNPRLDKATLDLFAEETGGYDSIAFRREYLCQFEKDDEIQIIPGWDDIKKNCVIDYKPTLPPYYDLYEGMDLGFKDLTFYISGFYNYRENTFYCENEIVLNGGGLTTDVLTESIKKNRADNFKGKAPHKSVMDVDLRLQNDLRINHGIHFDKADKEDKHTNLNNLVLQLKQGLIKISETGCPTLISHLNAGVWDKNKKNFARKPGFGHFDGIDALLYLSRAIQRNRNPYPADYGFDHENMARVKQMERESIYRPEDRQLHKETTQALKALAKGKIRRPR